MGNLTLEVNILKNRLAIGEELDKKRDFPKWYKHNVEIWKKSRVKVE